MIPVVIIVIDEGFDLCVRPKEGSQCWIVPECGPYDRPKVDNMLYFKAFFPDSDDLVP